MRLSLKTKNNYVVLKKGVILTKDNLATRILHSSKTCFLCTKSKTIQHIFFECQ